MTFPWIAQLYSWRVTERLARAASTRHVGAGGGGGGWFRGCQTAVDSLLGAAIGLAVPPRCAACGGDEPQAGGLRSVAPRLCRECSEAAVPLEAGRCSRCGCPVGPFVDAANGCARCRRDRFRFDKVIRLGIYESALREMCLAAKRPRAEELTAALAELLWQREERDLREAHANLAIPIPHHWTENLRPSGHAPETLASVLASRLRVDLATHILAKTRRTEKQSHLPRSRRRTNLKGAFHVPRRFHSRLKGRRILLVDDVLTTGATADEASRTLRAAGASCVTVAVIARGLGQKPVLKPTG